eukprot:GILI01011333.1.p2 GENE.GILI01011333.1~~GILI01011333.1.p2  ORF type:complete len:286 (+),score=73.36 GILI01011333.1:59-916(+)
MMFSRLRVLPKLPVFSSRRAFSSSVEFGVERLAGADEGIAVFSISRPESKNALGKVLMSQFKEALQSVRFDKSVRVVLLRSTVDGVFCAGADLKERAKMTPPEVAAFVTGLRSTFSELENLPMPTIACIEGAALGGGLELAMSCDLRVASRSAKFGLPETSLAIIPGAGGTQRLSRLIGVSKAKELVFTARRFSPEEAEKLGVINHLTEQGQSFNKGLELAREILPNGPVAVKVAKLAISRGSEVDLSTGFSFEEQCYAQVIPTKDREEGLLAFREKRKPVYKGE